MHHAAEEPPVGADAEYRRGNDPVEMGVGRRMIQQDHVLRRFGVCVAEMRLHPGLPVGMSDSRRATGEHQLPGHKVVMGDRIAREMTEIAETEGAKRIATRQIMNLLPDMPVMAMPA